MWSQRQHGWLLAALQVGLLTWLALGTPLRSPAPLAGCLLVAAVGLGAWAVRHMTLRQLRVTPAPAPQSRLIRTGPYAWIRHPMYAAAMLFAVALLIHHPTRSRLGAVGALALVLVAKIHYEEAALVRQFPDYSEYARTTGRFLPRVRLPRSES